jgi:hypothetical protein
MARPVGRLSLQPSRVLRCPCVALLPLKPILGLTESIHDLSYSVVRTLGIETGFVYSHNS